MATPVPPQAPGTDPNAALPPVSPYPIPPQYVPDPTGAYRKVIASVSPFQMGMGMGQPGAEGAPVPQEIGTGGITSNALTRRMQRNDDQARRQQEQPPSPIASQSI